MLRQAFEVMLSGRPGPVNLDVPLNVFAETCDAPCPARPVAAGHLRRCAAADADVAAILTLLAAARRPVIVAGTAAERRGRRGTRRVRGGGRHPGGQLPAGQGTADPRSPLYLGATGRNGT